MTGCGGATAGGRTPISSQSATEQTRPAAAVLAASAQALRGAASFRVSGMVDPGLDVEVTVSGDDSAGTISTHGVTWHEVTSGGRVFFKGAALWTASGTPAAAALGDQWVQVSDPAAGYRMAGLLPDLRAALAGIVFGPHPALVNLGEATVNGQRVVELRSSHDLYDVLDSNPPYPVRWIDQDTVTAGGAACGMTIDDVGALFTITAPQATAALTPPPSPAS